MQYEAKLKLKLETAYYNGEISREHFHKAVLRSGGVPLIAAATAGQCMAVNSHFFDGNTEPISSPHINSTNPSGPLHFFKQLFLRNPKTVSYHVGTEHPVNPGRIHFDNAHAAGRLRSTIALFSDPNRKIRYTSKPFLSGHLAGDILCVGDCRSSLIARNILQYQIAEDGDMHRDKDPILQLRFERLYNPAQLAPSDKFITREANGITFETQNTFIKDRDNPHSFIRPNISLHNRRLISDFLLITVVPNIFDQASYENGSRVVIFGGTHGIGTRSLGLLLDDEQYLKFLHDKVKAFSYWQALIEVEVKREGGWELPIRLRADNVRVGEVLVKGDVGGFWPYYKRNLRGTLVGGIGTLLPKDIPINESQPPGRKSTVFLSSSPSDEYTRRSHISRGGLDPLERAGALYASSESTRRHVCPRGEGVIVTSHEVHEGYMERAEDVQGSDTRCQDQEGGITDSQCLELATRFDQEVLYAAKEAKKRRASKRQPERTSNHEKTDVTFLASLLL